MGERSANGKGLPFQNEFESWLNFLDVVLQHAVRILLVLANVCQYSIAGSHEAKHKKNSDVHKMD
jgi:hypothetical protein